MSIFVHVLSRDTEAVTKKVDEEVGGEMAENGGKLLKRKRGQRELIDEHE